MMNNRINLMNIKALFALLILCSANFNTVAQTTPDPGLMGPHTVVKAQYNLGDVSYTPPSAAAFSWPMEERGSVHYPSDLNNGPYPVLVWLHGRHSTCYNTTTFTSSSAWPCPTGRAPILSYEGYDYAARTMASHGYIVISISANSINAHDGSLPDAGMNARGVLVQHHLDLWKGWSTTDTGAGTPFGSLFKGRLNLQKVGTMGHSRGGEGVVYNAEYNASLGSPYGIKAILTLAPVDFYRHVANNVPLLNIAPNCDGDVSDLQGVHFYDDVRYNVVTDEAPKHNIVVMGANHNFYNTVWTPGSWIAGGADDWEDYGYDPFDPHCGTTQPSRLDSTRQMAMYNTYAAAFYRLYLGGETKFAPILEVNDIVPPTSSTLDTNDIYVSYHAGKTDRLDVNTMDAATNLTVNTLTGSVTSTGITSPAICGGGLTLPVCDPGLGNDQKPHRGTGSIKGLGQMRIQWSDTTHTYENNVPATYQNFTTYQNLSFRACVNFSEALPTDNNDFTVQLIDSAGAISSRAVKKHTYALFYPQGAETGTLPKVLFNTIHIPIDSFKNINLAKVRKIKFLFNKSSAGAILVSDLALDNPVCGNLDATFTDSVPTTGKKIFFTNKSTTSVGDTVTRLWKFGDPASGVNDTSTAANPNHTYSVSGTYNVCLYVTVKRKNGLTCVDSFCKTVTRPVRAGVENLNTPEITVIPNPAKDYLQINGAEKTDVLRLINLYGQEVFTATLTNSIVSLPQTIPTGLYYAIIVTPKGNVHQKILISR